MQNPVVTAWKVSSGNPSCSALACRQVTRSAEPASCHLSQPFRQHGMVQIGGDDMTLLAHPRFNQQREIGRSRSDVQRPPVGRPGHIARQ